MQRTESEALDQAIEQRRSRPMKTRRRQQQQQQQEEEQEQVQEEEEGRRRRRLQQGRTTCPPYAWHLTTEAGDDR